MIITHQRGVAQAGSAPGLGPGGREFASLRPDHLKKNENIITYYFYITNYCSSIIGFAIINKKLISRKYFWLPLKTQLIF